MGLVSLSGIGVATDAMSAEIKLGLTFEHVRSVAHCKESTPAQEATGWEAKRRVLSILFLSHVLARVVEGRPARLVLKISPRLWLWEQKL